MHFLYVVRFPRLNRADYTIKNELVAFRESARKALESLNIRDDELLIE
jgi:hypothetical protein